MGADEGLTTLLKIHAVKSLTEDVSQNVSTVDVANSDAVDSSRQL